jgi:hypothetical protein
LGEGAREVRGVGDSLGDKWWPELIGKPRRGGRDRAKESLAIITKVIRGWLIARRWGDGCAVTDDRGWQERDSFIELRRAKAAMLFEAE